nr:F0F1 ATP synthase subunit epsilon [Nakamurella antarctica]
MHVELVAVEREIWSGPAASIVARTTEGDIGILPGHAPLLAQLKEGFGAKIIHPDGTETGVAVHGGFLSVTKTKVSILAEDAQLADEIDINAARAAYDVARRHETSVESADLLRARAQLMAVGQQV